MIQTILITGATQGIGLATARRLVAAGHRVLLHGRDPDKLAEVRRSLEGGHVPPDSFVADLAMPSEIDALARAVAGRHDRLDVLVNNAGVLKVARPRTAAGRDLRFVVNSLAPVRLTRRLLPLMGAGGRVVNLSSAAQAPVDLDALEGRKGLSDFAAYAQSKLALTMWSAVLADELGPDGPAVIAVNPGSMLNTRMVREGFGGGRASVDVGAEILERAALSPEFADASGRYFDNDAGAFAAPHPDAGVPARVAAVTGALERLAMEVS